MFACLVHPIAPPLPASDSSARSDVSALILTLLLKLYRSYTGSDYSFSNSDVTREERFGRLETGGDVIGALLR